jgi:TRAP-type C4-dicarboxylate transport system permease small subunit
MRRLPFDEAIASLALALMTLIPLVEIALRPLHGRGIDNAPLLVQHLGLALAMFGAILAERSGHLTTLGGGLAASANPRVQQAARWPTACPCGGCRH